MSYDFLITLLIFRRRHLLMEILHTKFINEHVHPRGQIGPNLIMWWTIDKVKGHVTNNYFQIKKETSKFIERGYRKKYLEGFQHVFTSSLFQDWLFKPKSLRREDKNQHDIKDNHKPRHNINMIVRCFSSWGEYESIIRTSQSCKYSVGMVNAHPNPKHWTLYNKLKAYKDLPT